MHAKLLRQVEAAFIEMSPAAKIKATAAIASLALAATALVYVTGGARFAYLHFMYVPVILAGLAFGVLGGILTGLAGGLLLGPMMPINTSTGEMQDWHNWFYRLGFFVLIGSLVGTWHLLQRRHIKELEWLHEHHGSTDLLNLPGLIKRLDALLGDESNKTGGAVSITQLDDFLAIQNTFGIDFGTKVLDAVIARMRHLVPPGSLVALIETDRLASVVWNKDGKSVTRAKIEEAIKESYLIDGVPIHVEASVGVAHFPDHGKTSSELLQKAGIALHWAQSSESVISLYDSANDRTSKENLILLGTLPQAIERGELRVWHQAKIALATGEVSGTEALLRWQHPQFGLVPAGRFMPQVEETSLVNPVTQSIIAMAFTHARSWRAAGHRLRVSVNLSVHNLRDKMLLEVLEQNAQRNGLVPADIDLEIVESALMVDPDYCIRLISLLREKGYGVSIDDFGTGHSSFAYLQKLHVSCLKIDQAFIKTLSNDDRNQKIVHSILHLAQSLGIETVAEGVEDDGAIELLRAWGCDHGQGYRLHRPAPLNELLTFLDERRRSANGKVGAI